MKRSAILASLILALSVAFLSPGSITHSGGVRSVEAARALAGSGYALDLGSGNAYVTFGNNSTLGLAQFTLETWFKREGTGATASSGSGGLVAVPLVTKGRSEADASNVDMNCFLGIDGASNVIAADFEEGAAGGTPGLNHPIRGVTPISLNVWYHAAATYDGNKWQLFLNGNLEAELIAGQPPRSDSIQHAGLGVAMNSTGTPAGHFDGVLDEVRIWNYARSQAQIQSTLSAQITSSQKEKCHCRRTCPMSS